MFGRWMAVLVVLGTLAEGGPAQAAPKRESVSVAIADSAGPFTLLDPTGAPAGLLIEMWRLWANATGVDIRFVARDWPGSLQAVRTGAADLHSGLFRSPERQTWLEFSHPIHEVETALFGRATDGVPPALTAWPGGPVGTVIGTYQQTWLAETHPDIESIGYVDSTAAFVGLLRREVAAIIEEAPAAAAAINRIGLPGNFLRRPESLFFEALRVGVRAGNPALLDLVNQGFQAIPRDGLATLEARWLPNPADRFYAGGTGTITVSDEEAAWLEAHPVIRLGTTGTFPPYGFFDHHGELQGFDVDLIDLLNRKLGTQIVPEVFDTWDGAVTAALAWTIDGLLGVAPSPKRSKRMLFTPPYAFEPLVLVGRRDGPVISDWDALSGLSLSMEAGADVLIRLLHDLGINPDMVRQVRSDLEGYALVRSGAVNIHLGWNNTFREAAATGQAEGLVIRLRRNMEASGLHIGIPGNRRPLLGVLRKGLNAITIAEMAELRERWLTPARGPDTTRIALTPDERRLLDNLPDLIVANETDWPPFDFVENGKPAGFSIDLLRLAATKLGVQLRFVNGYTWAELLTRFRAGEIDVLPAVYRTGDRETFIAFTESYAVNPSVLVRRNGDDTVAAVADLVGRRAATIESFATTLVMAERWPDIEQVPVVNVLEGLTAVSTGRVDAFFGSLGTISHVLSDTYLPNLELVGEVTLKHPDETRLHMGVLRGNEALRDLLQKALDAIPAQDLERVRQRWIPSMVPVGADNGNRLNVPLRRDQRDWLRRLDRLRVGDDFAEAPYSFLDESGAFAGISAGYLDAVADRLELEVSAVPMASQAGAVEALALGEVDIVPVALGSNGEAADGLAVTTAYAAFPAVIATRRDAPFVARMDDLAGSRVGLGARHLDLDHWRRTWPSLVFEPFGGAPEGLMALADGQVAAYVDDLGSVSFEIDRLQTDSVRIAAPTSEMVEFAFAVRPDWPELVEIINAALGTLSDTERTAIRHAWLAVNVTVGLDAATVLLWATPFAVSAAAIILVIMVWNRRLGREVAERKAAQAKLSDAYREIQSSIGYASNIQRSLLPATGEFLSVFDDHCMVWQPRDLVGGDMLWTRRWGDGTLLILGDCTGHGVPGAFMTLITTGALDRARHEVPAGDVSLLVRRLHQLVKTTLSQESGNGKADDGLELGACFIPDGTPETMTFCGARFSLFVVEAGAVREMRGGRKGIGYRAIPLDHTWLAERIAVQSGMAFYLVSDGVIDQIGGPKRRAFGRKRFVAALAAVAGQSMAEQARALIEALEAHQGNEPRRDDVSMVGFRLRSAQAA